MPAIRQVGVVVHPSRHIDRVLAEIGAWASANKARVGQVRIEGQTREVAAPVDAADCDLLIAVGGDGTALAALHAAAPESRPVLGVACGSVGALTSATADRLTWALDQVSAERWTPMPIPALDVSWDDGSSEIAINDVVALRDGAGQVIASVVVDDVRYVRVAGDGVVAATELGSSAYSMAAGGPILAPGVEAIVVTPLAAHGGSAPPLVMAGHARLDLEVEPSYGGVRFEVDGRPTAIQGRRLEIRRRSDYTTLVTLAEGEPRFTGLRRRGLVLDSPRVLVRDARTDAVGGEG